MWNAIKKGALSLGSAVGIDAAEEGLHEMELAETEKKKRTAAKREKAHKYGRALSHGEKEYDPFDYTEDEYAAIKAGDKGAMREAGLTSREIEHLGGENKVDWKGMLDTAARFLSSRKTPEAPPPARGGSVNFDAGSYYGALAQNPFKDFNKPIA